MLYSKTANILITLVHQVSKINIVKRRTRISYNQDMQYWTINAFEFNKTSISLLQRLKWNQPPAIWDIATSWNNRYSLLLQQGCAWIFHQWTDETFQNMRHAKFTKKRSIDWPHMKALTKAQVFSFFPLKLFFNWICH